MSQSFVVDRFHSVIPYFHLKGAEQFIDFLIKAFDGRELTRTTDIEGRIQHAEIQIHDAIVECSEGQETFPPISNSIHLYVDDCDSCYKRALAAGATPLFPPENRRSDERIAGIKDSFGNIWNIATYLGTIK
jgi:uncharacterized glyoxalase superfamily protein PhnB